MNDNGAANGSKATLYGKMAQIMGKIDRVPKRGKNRQQNYDFVTESDIADAVRKAMAEVNLALLVSMESVERETTISSKGTEGTLTRAVFAFTFACGDTGETHTCRWESEALDYGDKGLNKVATAAEKYFLLKTFILSTGDAAEDSDASGDEVQRRNGKNDRKIQHWTQTQDWQAFWVTAKDDLGLTEQEVHEVAGVDSMKEYRGEKKALWMKLSAFADAKKTTPDSPQDATEAGQGALADHMAATDGKRTVEFVGLRFRNGRNDDMLTVTFFGGKGRKWLDTGDAPLADLRTWLAGSGIDHAGSKGTHMHAGKATLEGDVVTGIALAEKSGA